MLFHFSALATLLLTLITCTYAQVVRDTLHQPFSEYFSYFGNSISFIADINQDSVPEILVGAPRADYFAAGNYYEGISFVFDGSDGQVVRALRAAQDIWDNLSYSLVGSAVASLNTIQETGQSVVLVGAPLAKHPNRSGMMFVFRADSGASGVLLDTLRSPNPDTNNYFGCSVARLNNINNDGRPDFIVGAYQESISPAAFQAGRAYIYNGRNDSLLFQLQSPSPETHGQFGWSVCEIGDINDDGRSDFAVGAPFESSDSLHPRCGSVHIYNGATGALIRTLVSPRRQRSGFFGFSISSAGDLSSDGIADILIGANQESTATGSNHSGCVYAFNGATGQLIHTLQTPNECEWGRFGNAVSTAGDVDNDGVPEILIGAPGEHTGTNPSYSGMAYIFNGATGQQCYSISSPGSCLDGHFGQSVCYGGLINDGGNLRPFIAVSAPLEQPQSTGNVYLYTLSTTGVKENGHLPPDATVELYPNPMNQSVTIRFVLPGVTKLDYTWNDVLGRQVEAGVWEVHSGTNVKTVTLKFSSGTYYLKWKAGSKYSGTKKLVLLK